MRTITQVLLGLGFVGAMAVSAPITSNAQGVYYTGPGVGIQVVNRPYRHRHAQYDRYYGGHPYGYRYYRGPDYGRNSAYSGYSRYPGYVVNPPSTY